MRRNTLIQLSVALLLSLVAGVLIFSWMKDRTLQQAQVAPKGPEKVMVAVAQDALRQGLKLSAKNIVMAPFLKESLPAGTVSNAESLEGRVLASAIGKGEPFTESRLMSSDIAGGVSTLIAPGKRAVAVKGNKVMGLSGFIRPGNRVDVLVTIVVTKNAKDIPVSKTVLEQIKVLATGTELEVTGEDGETSPVDVYTLELTTEESETLALAATQGTLHFALRNPTDEKQIKTSGKDIAALLNSLKTAGTTRIGKKPRKVSTAARVEVITGSERKIMRFSHAQ